MSNVDDSNAISLLERFREKIRDLTKEETQALLIALFVVAVGAGVISIAWKLVRNVELPSALSPDGEHWIVMRERPIASITHNFQVFVIDDTTREERRVFHSLDQKGCIHFEHFIWSADGRFAALIGDLYYVVPESILPNGLTLFLVYDLETDQIYCNTANEGRGYPPITAEEAIKIFGEDRLNSISPIRLRR